MNIWPLLLESSSSAIASAGEWSTASLLALALGFLVAAVLLIVLEFFIVSGGVIGALAAISAVCSIWIGFSVHPLVGWALVIIIPIIFYNSIRMGVKRLQSSSFVPQANIEGNAGYKQVADALGIQVGSIGEMTTNAMPTGRCHFPGGEIDVAMESGSGQRMEQVIVTRIDGPEIWVRPHHV